MLLDSLFYYNRLQNQKQEELRRLREALSSLEGYQEELISQQKLIREPELTVGTWTGELAGEFENIRVNGMVTQHRALHSEQMESALDSIQSKISSIHSELSFIDHKITGIRYEMATAESK